MLLKYLIILILIIYVLYKVAGFFFRLGLGGFRVNPDRFHSSQDYYRRQAPESNLNIDSIPHQKKGKDSSGFDEGEYVDFEEVK